MIAIAGSDGHGHITVVVKCSSDAGDNIMDKYLSNHQVRHD